jgi:hypothetical protein
LKLQEEIGEETGRGMEVKDGIEGVKRKIEREQKEESMSLAADQRGRITFSSTPNKLT